MYDRCCPSCEWRAIDVWEPVHQAAPACPTCGELTTRAWLSKAPTAIGDEMYHWQVNGLAEPRLFESKQDHRRWMKESGYYNATRHVGMDGTDKSKFTTNWAATYDPYTAENARILVERAFRDGTTHDDELTPLTAKVYTGELGSAEHQAFLRTR